VIFWLTLYIIIIIINDNNYRIRQQGLPVGGRQCAHTRPGKRQANLSQRPLTSKTVWTHLSYSWPLNVNGKEQLMTFTAGHISPAHKRRTQIQLELYLVRSYMPSKLSKYLPCSLSLFPTMHIPQSWAMSCMADVHEVLEAADKSKFCLSGWQKRFRTC